MIVLTFLTALMTIVKLLLSKARGRAKKLLIKCAEKLIRCDSCCICGVEDCQVAPWPCGHWAFCMACFNQISFCALCRGRIEGVVLEVGTKAG